MSFTRADPLIHDHPSKRVKYAESNRNRLGLRELLMEPVQRIPRYTLLFRQMIKQMSPNDPQRAKLEEADELASKIALAEIDEQTKLAATMFCLKSSIADFPDGLWSHSRKYIDCIDVHDYLNPGAMEGLGTPGGGAGGLLHCTLFLFEDKLVIAKRLNTDKPAKILSGLDQLHKIATQPKTMTNSSKKMMMVYKGQMDIAEITATDNGGAGMFSRSRFKPGLAFLPYVVDVWRYHKRCTCSWRTLRRIRWACGDNVIFVNSAPSFPVLHPMSTLRERNI